MHVVFMQIVSLDSDHQFMIFSTLWNIVILPICYEVEILSQTLIYVNSIGLYWVCLRYALECDVFWHFITVQSKWNTSDDHKILLYHVRRILWKCKEVFRRHSIISSCMFWHKKQIHSWVIVKPFSTDGHMCFSNWDVSQNLAYQV
jgi:hypothetical protein